MNLGNLSIKRPVFIMMVILSVMVLGLNAYFRLPVELFPKIDIPWVTVVTVYPGANPEEIETQITDKLEDELSSLSDLKSMKSESAENLSMIALEFKIGVDLDAKSADVRDKVSAARNILPDDADEPMVLKMELDSFPIMFFSVSSPRPPVEVRRVAKDVIKKKLETVPGVAAVSLLGGKEREIQVAVDRNKLAARNISIMQVIEALGRDNLNVPIGKIKKGAEESLIRVVGEFDSVEEIGEVEIPTNEGPVAVRDIADVRDDFKEITEYARLMNENAVSLSLTKQSGANTVSVSNNAIKEMKKLEEQLPDFNVKLISDLSKFIKDAVADVQQNLLYGALFATLAVLLFLRDARTTFIIFLAIPTSIISTFMPVYAAGFTINFMSLMGLAISVGTLVDNSSVVLENIFRHIEMGKTPADASRDAINEVGLAVMASGTTNICVFLPVAFMTGMTGQFFKEFGLTVTFATIFSIFIAFTLTPALSARWLKSVSEKDYNAKSRPQSAGATLVALLLTAAAVAVLIKFVMPAFNGMITGAGGGVKVMAWIALLLVMIAAAIPAFKFGIFPGFDGFYGRLSGGYPKVLAFCLRRRFLVVSLVVVVFFITLFISTKLGFEFVGHGDTGEFQVLVEMPPYATLDDTDTVIKKIEGYIGKIPEMEVMSSAVGSKIGNTGVQSSDPNFGYVRVKLIDMKQRDRSTDEIMQVLRKQVADIPDAIFQISQASMGGPPGQLDMEIEVSGPDMETLVPLARKVEQVVKDTPGTIDVNNSWKLGKHEVRVLFNKKRMKEFDLDVGTVAATLRTAIEGNTDVKYRERGEEYDIRVRFAPEQRANVTDVGDITIPAEKGIVKVSSIARIVPEQGPVGISRKDGERMISIGCNLAGVPIGTVQKEITNTIYGKKTGGLFAKKNGGGQIKPLDVPPGYEIKFAGQSEDMAEMFTQMMLAIVMAIVFVYMVMAAQFESLSDPFVIMGALPLTFIGVIWSLFIARMTINMMSLIGIVMLVGIVVNNSIILIDFVNQYRARGVPRDEALMQCGPLRLRPILITSLSTIAGMIPAAFTQGSGGGFRQPMAVAGLGGMVVSTLLTLLVIPTFYTLMDDFTNFMRRKFFKNSVGRFDAPGAPRAG